MKKNAPVNNLRSLLGPSKFSADGFLGTDPREPEEIIRDDLETMSSMGAKKSKIISALKSIFLKAQSHLGSPIQISPCLTARYYESRGKIPSPFRKDGFFQKGEVEIVDTRDSKTLFVTPLSIDLIEKHDFFQGHGSRYRIEPRDIVEICKLINF